MTTVGPLHNQVPAPGPRDNNTIWYQDTTPKLYSELYFGVGPKAGVIVQHPNLGKVDLRGNTMANYYLEQSEGKYLPKGEVYPNWLQAAHSEGWYGADNESGSNHNIRAADLVQEVVDGINADDPDFPWQQYDGNGDGVVDNFTVIHAGQGQEGGGGQQGDFAIWSHASALAPPTGYLACKAGTHGATRDIYVREYSMDPEHLDVGVIAEEYGHAAFGLPGHLHHGLRRLRRRLGDHGGRLLERPARRHAAGAVPALLPLSGRLGRPDRRGLRQGRRDDHQGRPALAASQEDGTGRQDRPPRPGHRHRQPDGHRQGLVVRQSRPGRLLPVP